MGTGAVAGGPPPLLPLGWASLLAIRSFSNAELKKGGEGAAAGVGGWTAGQLRSLESLGHRILSFKA